MLTIGEFSRATGLTVKTLRFYHEQGVLLPSCVDDQTGYRYYGPEKLETARVIAMLRKLEFSLADITDILAQYDDEADILDYLERHRAAIEEKLAHYRQIDRSLGEMVIREREYRRIMTNADFQIEEKTITPMLVAGLRMQGRYSDCGKGFSRIGRKFGFRIKGKPLMLIYDTEYKEDDADFEVCMPIRKGESVDEITVRELPGGRCLSLLHKGPYDGISSSYAQLFAYAKEHGHQIATPTREVYIKGPGMIFKGNPKKYLTEIQMLIGGAA